jgi:hypothetical protein
VCLRLHCGELGIGLGFNLVSYLYMGPSGSTNGAFLFVTISVNPRAAPH